MVHLVSMY